MIDQTCLAIGHVDHFDVALPKTDQREDILEALLERLDAQGALCLQFALSQSQQLGILELERFDGSLGAGRISGDISGGLLDHGALFDVVVDKFEFRSVSHVPDLSLQVSKQWLEQQILVFD